MTEADITLLIIALHGPIISALGLATRRAKPNPLLGVRTAATFADPRVWADANRRAGTQLIWGGLAILVVGIVLILTPLPDPAKIITAITAPLIATAIFATDAIRHANRRLAHYQAQDQHTETSPPTA